MFQKKHFYIWDIIEKCLKDVPLTHQAEGRVPLTGEEDEEEEEDEIVLSGSEEERLRGGNFIVGLSSNQEIIGQLNTLVARINRFSRIGKQEKVSHNTSSGVSDFHSI